jgi:hypothetical protein
MKKQPPSTANEPRRVAVLDKKKSEGKLKVIGGSQSDTWNQVLGNQTMQALWMKNADADEQQNLIDATVAALMGIGPNDELEGMMAAQLIASHNASMECFRRAMIGEQTFEGRKENLNQANKLSRTWSTLLQALDKHRGKGQQKVTVEHVHVHAGGQAVVGAVEHRGDGVHRQKEEQPHAKQITNAPESAMRGTDTQRERMPVTGDEE